MLTRRHVRRPPSESHEVAKHAGGQALVEFALILTPLMMILLGILQFAFVFGTQLGITNAVREAARLGASVPTYSGALATTNGQYVYNKLTVSGGLLTSNVQAYLSSQLVTSGGSLTQVCYTTYTDPAGVTQVKIKVEAYYRHPLFVPLISSVLDGLDGVVDNALRVGASEEIRVENPPSVTAASLSSNPQCVSS